MKHILIYTDGVIDTYYVHTDNGKHLIINERNNKVVHAHDITYNSQDRHRVDKYLRQMGEQTTRQLDRQSKRKKL